MTDFYNPYKETSWWYEGRCSCGGRMWTPDGIEEHGSPSQVRKWHEEHKITYPNGLHTLSIYRVVERATHTFAEALVN